MKRNKKSCQQPRDDRFLIPIYPGIPQKKKKKQKRKNYSIEEIKTILCANGHSRYQPIGSHYDTVEGEGDVGYIRLE